MLLKSYKENKLACRFKNTNIYKHYRKISSQTCSKFYRYTNILFSIVQNIKYLLKKKQKPKKKLKSNSPICYYSITKLVPKIK